MLGLVTYGKGVANDVLMELGITPEQIRKETLLLMDGFKHQRDDSGGIHPVSKKPNESLIFLKLGGSLITDKHTPRTPRLDIITRISHEIAAALKETPDLRLILGHGSGSFGHTSGSKHGTLNGVHTNEEWIGFAEVWHDAASLNQIVLKSLLNAGLPAVVFPPSASITAQNHKIMIWNIDPIKSAMENKLIPVVYGDVVFDTAIGGTILSTEDLFSELAIELYPRRILLAGREPGVYKDYPRDTTILSEIIPTDLDFLEGKIKSSGAPDVTGGMQSKVNQMLNLVKILPSLKLSFFQVRNPE